jgi:hypothetical protein
MVNVGFPPTDGYGFEMVDARRQPESQQNPHQSKIYSESISPPFSQNFASLNSMQTLEIY